MNNRHAGINGKAGCGFTPMVTTKEIRGVSGAELLHMREMGMSNNAIARSLGTYPQKIDKLIGKTPQEIVHAALVAGGKKRKLAATKPETPRGVLVKTYEAIKLVGKCAVYRLNHDRQVLTVKLRNANGDEIDGGFACTYTEIEPIIEELLSVTSEIDKLLKE